MKVLAIGLEKGRAGKTISLYLAHWTADRVQYAELDRRPTFQRGDLVRITSGYFVRILGESVHRFPIRHLEQRPTGHAREAPP